MPQTDCICVWEKIMNHLIFYFYYDLVMFKLVEVLSLSNIIINLVSFTISLVCVCLRDL